MKLFYSTTSPYARIARVAALECGRPAIEMIRVETRTPANPVLGFSPLGRVPTLVDGELVLAEARAIWQYLAGRINGGASALGGGSSWQEVAHEGLVLGFLDGIASWVRECRREPGQRSAFLIEVERQRAARCLLHFEGCSEALRAEPWSFPQAALAAALDLMDCYGLVEEWEVEHHGLFQWLDTCRVRPAMKATRPCS